MLWFFGVTNYVVFELVSNERKYVLPRKYVFEFEIVFVFVSGVTDRS
jgi:hypothetical protein